MEINIGILDAVAHRRMYCLDLELLPKKTGTEVLVYCKKIISDVRQRRALYRLATRSEAVHDTSGRKHSKELSAQSTFRWGLYGYRVYFFTVILLPLSSTGILLIKGIWGVNFLPRFYYTVLLDHRPQDGMFAGVRQTETPLQVMGHGQDFCGNTKLLPTHASKPPAFLPA